MQLTYNSITLFLLFAANVVFAQLTFVEELADGGLDQAGNRLNGLAKPYGVLTSPDDNYFYIAGIDDDAVTVFSRDKVTGELTFIESLVRNGVDQDNNVITGLLGAINMAMSVDGTHLYVVGLGNNVSVFARNASTGRLTFVEALFTGETDQAGNTIIGLQEAANIDISPDGGHVYVSARAGAGSLTVFSRDATTGRLTFVENLVDNQTDSDNNTLDGIRKPYGVRVSLDNRFVYVASNIETSIAVLARDLQTGQLTMVEVLRQNEFDQAGNPIGDALFGCNNLTISSDNRFLYVTAFSGDAVSVFSRDIESGILTFIQTLPNGSMDSNGNTITDLNAPQVPVVAPNRLYVGTQVAQSVVVFERDEQTGLLTFLESKVNETGSISLLNDPEGMTLSRDRKFLYATGDAVNGLVVFEEANPVVVETTSCDSVMATISAPLSGVETFTASETIECSSTISAGADISLYAEQAITLKENFHAKANAMFLARIQSCDSVALTLPTISSRSKDYFDVQASINSVEIYPNPATDQLQVRFYLAAQDAVALQLSDLKGHLVQSPLLLAQQEAGHHILPLDIASLLPGIYFLQFKTSTTLITKRVVVQ